MSVNSFSDNYFIFGGVDSRTYGIIVSNDNGFDAPERDVEEIEIPGRNGTLILDNGRFKNQTLTYSCVLKSNFDTQIDAFRAALCALEGYQRITDSFHPNVYRMGRIKGEIKTTPGSKYKNGKFDVVFDVKPQKFLTSGESVVSVADGGSITNPTQYSSSPLLKVDGFGDIVLNGQRLTVNEAFLGNVLIEDAAAWSSTGYANQLYLGALNTGDSFTINDITLNVRYTDVFGGFSRTHTHISASTFDDSNITFSDNIIGLYGGAYRTLNISLHTGAIGFEKGTDKNGTITASVVLKDVNHAATVTETITLAYSYSNGLLTLATTLPAASAYWSITANETSFKSITGFSTINANTQAYIDLEIGEAWKVVNGTAVEVNGIITLPPELPTLAPGSNTITYENTITSFSITPRWWTV